MPFDNALTAGELVKLRGDATTPSVYNKRVFISSVPNTNVYTARVDQSSFAYPLAQLDYNGGAGVLGDVNEGMLVIISHTNDRTAPGSFRGRVRKDPTSGILYINETGYSFADDDYIFIIDTYPLDIKLGRWANEQLFVDWDISFSQLKPIVYDLQSAYVSFIDTGTSVYTIAFAPTVQPAADGSTIVTYLWDVGDGTITVGTSATKNITATFPAGFRWVSFTTTDSNGNATTRRIKVWAHDTSSNAPTPLTVANIRITAETSISVNEGISAGYNASFDAFEDVSTLLDRTSICIWFDESYNGAAGSINSNIAMLGVLRNQKDATSYANGQRNAQAQFTVEGTMTQLANLRGTSIESTDNSSPDEWGEIDDFTIWRAIWFILSEFSTFGSLHSLNFTDFSDDFRYIGITTQGDNISDIISDLAQSINAVLQESAVGACEVVRRAVMLSASERNALVTVADMGVSDFYGSLGRGHDQFSPIGSLSGDGGGYDTSEGEVSAYDAISPQGAPNSGAGQGTLRRQILKADQAGSEEKSELKERTGNALASQQNADTLSPTLFDGWRFLTPSADQWYTWTIPAAHFVRGGALTTATRWTLQSSELSTSVGVSGIELSQNFIIETIGAPGGIVEWPILDVGLYPRGLGVFDIDALTFPPFTAFGSTGFDFTASDGGWVDDTGTYVVATGWEADCVGGTSEFLDISKFLGESKTIKSITVTYDATYGGGATSLNGILTRLDGGSWVVRKIGTTVTGVGQEFTVTFDDEIVADSIRVVMYASGTDCTGQLLVTSIDYETTEEAENWEHTFNFLLESGGFSANNTGSWASGTGWQSTDELAGNWFRSCNIKKAFTSSTITSCQVFYTIVEGNFSSPVATNDVSFFVPGETIVAQTPTGSNGNKTITYNGEFPSVVAIRTRIDCANDPLQVNLSGSIIITQMIVKGTGTNPFT